MNNKALIMSVGTGTRPEQENTLVHGLTYCIETHNPDMIFFIATDESEQKTLSKILLNINNKYEIVKIPDQDDIVKIYNVLHVKLKQIKNNYSHITVDFTSGTKAMTGALTILGSLFECDSLSYIAGDRKNGIVIKGTERIVSVQPNKIICDKKFDQAVKFFNKYQFITAADLIEEIEKILPTLINEGDMPQFKNALLAYSEWDIFNHQKAFEHIKKVENNKFNGNKSFLGKIINNTDKEPLYIADIISNARRRAEEGKYDDAVARLYRTIELIGQYKLKDYGINDTGNVPLDKIPQNLKQLFQPGNNSKTVRLGLEKNFKLLNEFGNELGKRFFNNKLRDKLNKRNQSILAHGLTPVDQKIYHELHDLTIEMAQLAVKDLNNLLEEAKFVKWQV